MPRYTPSNTMGRNVRVLLDGEELADVLEADDELGFIIQLVRDETGRVVFLGGEGKRQIKLGKVQVTFPVLPS